MRVKFITFGCSRNQADTELMKGLVSKEHELVETNPDVTVINSCFVKKDTEEKIISLMHKITNKLVLTGCLSQARPDLIEAFPNASFLGVKSFMRINEAIKNQLVDLSDGSPDFCSERVLTNPIISIVPISEGCLGSCSYCCTKQARGNLVSRPIDNILSQVKSDLANGVKEFWLTSQDTGCYGFDIKSDLSKLLDAITSLPGDFRVRVGMMNPQHALKILLPLRKSFDSPKLYKFIHVPIQSGSDKVLADMNRHYSVSDFWRVIDAFNGFSVSTDIICGYPTEGVSEWNETISLVKKLKPAVLNISRFFSRPGTPASLLKCLPSWVIKERSRELTKLNEALSLSRFQLLIGSPSVVLINEPGAGRDVFYNKVVVSAPFGSFVNARITGAKAHWLLGESI